MARTLNDWDEIVRLVNEYRQANLHCFQHPSRQAAEHEARVYLAFLNHITEMRKHYRPEIQEA